MDKDKDNKIDFSSLSPDTIITEEMLNPQEAEMIMVIANHKKDFEAIKYSGASELEAYSKYKSIPHNDKIIAKANVVYSDLFQEMYGTKFILSYDIIEVIK